MSRLPFELLLALRYLRPKRTFVSVITLISVLGVTMGVAVLIIVLSVMSGFDRQLRDRILGFDPHLRVVVPKHSIGDFNRLIARIRTNPSVILASPYVQGQVLVETQPPEGGQSQVAAPFLRGMDPKSETNVFSSKHLLQGSMDLGPKELLVGADFASNLELMVGDRLAIYSPSDLRKWRESVEKENARMPVPPEFEIRGIFDVGYYEYNSIFVIARLRDAQDLYDLGDTVHGITLTLKDAYDARRVQSELKRDLGPGYQVISWMDENSNLLNALVVEKNVMFYLLFFIMIVAALCILSALITFVVQKTREIGMLKALGAGDLQVSAIFLSQGAMVGAIGCLAGYGLGMLALAYRNEFLHFMDRMVGFQLFPPSIYGFTDLPALIIRSDILLICGSAFLICTLGGVIPAWLAGRLKPVDALRYE
jgi:lipoprotein-releasing system permease protein